MRAVIFAAGFGTRLIPLTNKKQKCMIDIAGKPCVERVMDHIQNFGVEHIIFKVHYKYEQVMEYFGDKAMYYYQKELKDEEATLKDMRHWLRDDYTLVANGDTITDVDISKMIVMAKGGNVKFMDSKDKEKYAGTMILSPSYWEGHTKFQHYYSPESKWMDIGTWTGLFGARRYFEKRR